MASCLPEHDTYESNCDVMRLLGETMRDKRPTKAKLRGRQQAGDHLTGLTGGGTTIVASLMPPTLVAGQWFTMVLGRTPPGDDETVGGSMESDNRSVGLVPQDVGQ